jgi:hypothetical protein
VAAKLGYDYVGVDLSARQIAANREQAAIIIPDQPPRWIHGDSTHIRQLCPGDYDLVFSCPPYADLERYSDDPADLSTMKYEPFLRAYRHILHESLGMLASDRFACLVVGDVRDERGFYRGFVADTIRIVEETGARLYNEAILVTAVGSLPVRVGVAFGRWRKLGKTHQNLLVFWKGDPKRIYAVCGECDFGGGEPMETPDPMETSDA